MEQGRVVEVSVIPTGDVLLADHILGATTLTVNDASDFSEVGGSLTVEGDPTIYTYSTKDDDLDTITLTGGLGLAASEGQRVLQYPLSEEKWAMVEVPNDEEPVSALVPHSLHDRFTDEIRDEADQESVQIDIIDGDWQIVNIIGKIPVVDGTYLDPVTVPPNPSDGNPPPSAPTPTVIGLYNSFIVKFDGVSNNDAVTYEYHISDTLGFTAVAATLHHTSPSNLEIVDSLADGSPLVPDTTYYFRVIAVDVDGPATQSGEAEAQLNLVGTQDIAVGAVTAAKLEAVIAFLSKLVIGTSGTRSIELGLENGLVVTESDGNQLFSVPTEQGVPLQMTVDAILSAATILGNLAIRGTTNEISKDSLVRLASSISTPLSAPSHSIDWDKITAWTGNLDFRGGGAGDCFNLQWDGTDYISVNSFFGANMFIVGSGGAFGGNIHLPKTWEDDGGGENVHFFPVSATYLADTGRYYVLGLEDSFGSGRDTYIVKVYTINKSLGTATFITDWEWGWTSAAPPPSRPAIGPDAAGTGLIIARCLSDGEISWRPWTVAGVAGTTVNTGHIITASKHISSVIPITGATATAEHLGGDRYVITTDGAPSEVRVFNTSGTRQSNEEWPPANNSRIVGICHNGTNFRSADAGTSIWKYERNAWTTESTKWWASYTWYDSDATGGTHETAQSTKKSFTMTKRAKLTITSPNIPDLGGTDDPDTVRFYLGRGTSAPAATAMWRQGSEGTKVKVITDATFSGNNPPTSNNFPTAGAASLESNDGGTYVKGDGSVRIGGTGSILAVVKVGSGTYDFDATPGETTVTHGLGGTPIYVGVNNGNALYNARTFALGATTFKIGLVNSTTGADITGDRTCEWIAVVPV